MNLGGYVKTSIFLASAVLFLSAASSLVAGEVVVYGGVQNPGKLTWSSATNIPAAFLDGNRGSTMGIRLSAGRVIGFEQSIGYSPKFAKSGVKAFLMDSNLLVQARGKVAPYATAGIGFIKTWGQEYSSDLDPAKLAAYAFSFGRELSINYGGGIKLRRVLGPLGFGVDVRGYTVPSVYDGSLNFLQTTIGAVFTW
jgi:hypothetical protein